MFRTLLLLTISVYSVILVALEARGGPAAVSPYLLDEVGPPLAHVHATLSLSLLIATAILLGVAGRIERLSGRQTASDRWIGLTLAALLVAVAVEDRFRLLPAWSGGSVLAERSAWLGLAGLGSASLIALARTRLGRTVPRGLWIAGAGGFAATFLADTAGGTWLVVEDLPRIWGAMFLLLAAVRMLEHSITETALAGPAGSAWELGLGLAGYRPPGPNPRLTEIAQPRRRRRTDAPPAPVLVETPDTPDEKRGIRPEDECPEPDRRPLRASAAPPRKLLSH